MSTKITKQEREEARAHLLEMLQPGDRVYCILKHVSRSGMYRVIDLYVMKDNQPLRISGYAARLLEGYDRNHEGCRASGCGMDMGFHLVYNLGYSLWPNGFDCVGEHCHSNDHFNGADVQHHHDGGYALRCEWM